MQVRDVEVRQLLRTYGARDPARSLDVLSANNGWVKCLTGTIEACMRATEPADPFATLVHETRALLEKAVRHVNVAMDEAAGLDEALAAAYHHEEEAMQHILVLDFPSLSVNAYLREHDKPQLIKFIVHPDHPQTVDDPRPWRIYTVEHRHQPHCVSVALARSAPPPWPVPFVSRRRHYARCDTREAAIALCKASLQQHWSSDNRLFRAVRMLTGRTVERFRITSS